MPERFEIYIAYKWCYINALPFLSLPYSCSATNIILAKKNYRSLLSLRFTLSLESTPHVSPPTSFWYQFNRTIIKMAMVTVDSSGLQADSYRKSAGWVLTVQESEPVLHSICIHHISQKKRPPWLQP